MGFSLTLLLLAGASTVLLAFVIKLSLKNSHQKKTLEKTRNALLQLEQASRSYRMLAEKINDVIYIFDITNLQYTYASPSVIRSYGFTPEELTRLTIDKLLTPQSLEAVLNILNEELAQDNNPGVDPDRHLTLELEQYRKDGSIIQTETTARFFRDETGKPVSIAGVVRDIGERKKAETALRESEKLHRMLAENINDVIYIVDINTLRYTYTSPSVIRTHGFTPEEMATFNIDQILTPRSLESSIKTLGKELEQDNQPGADPNRYLTLEMEQYRQDGSTMLVETVNKFLRDEAGSPVSIVGVARDITEKRKAETALRESEARYRLLADNISEMVAIIRLEDQKHIYITPSVEKVRGFTAEEVMTQPLDQILPPESYELAMRVLTEELELDGRTGIDPDRHRALEIEQYCKDGSTIWTEVFASLIRDETEKPICVLAAARDITDRKAAGNALRESEKRYRMLAESISEVIYIINLETMRYEFVTPSVEQIHGYTPEEFIQLPLGKVLTPATLEMAMGYIERELESDGKPGVDPDRYVRVELEVYRKDGTTLFMENSARFLRDETGKPVSLLGLARDISERKKTETALRESEARYRMLAENITEVISIIDIETMRYTYTSPSVDKLFGHSPEERVPLSLTERLTPKTIETIFNTIKEELERDGLPGIDPDRHVIFNAEAYHKNGSILGMETVARFLRDESGKPVSVLAVSRDISERKKAETALRESEERYRMLAENISEVILVFDLNKLCYTYASPSTIKMFGYSPEETVSMPLNKLFTQKSLEMVFNSLVEGLEKESQAGVDPDRYVILDVEAYHKNGSIVQLETTARFIRDKNGKPIFGLGVARNVSDRKKAEIALRESEERYRMLADNISEVIYLIDLPSLRHVYISPSVYQVHGWTPEEYVELSLDKVLTPDSLKRALKTIETEITRGYDPETQNARFVTLELEEYRKDGSTLWLENVARVYHNDEGEPVSIIGVARDITERKKVREAMKEAKEAAEAANRAKSEFLANMSHEIRTPMNGIIGMTELLFDTSLSSEQSEYAQTVKDSADTLLVILNDVLDFSKIEAGMLELETIDFNLRSLAKGIHDSIQPRAEKKQIAYNTIIKDDVPFLLKGDPVRLRQALFNLCENAIKFTEAGSIDLSISLDSQSDATVTLLFEVSDTGIGIPRESHSQIFDSFSQVDASTTRKYGGTGLGLAITRRLVSLMGGQIGVTSDPDRGATFRFTVMFAKQGRQPRFIIDDTQQRASSPVPGGMPPLKILIAEDNPISCKVLTEMLEKMGHTVVISLNGVEAVDAFGRQAFDMVLMDIQMPIMDGITATRKIKDLQQGNERKVPIIAVTANAMAGDRERFLSQGMDDYIAKPFKMETLAAVILRNIP